MLAPETVSDLLSADSPSDVYELVSRVVLEEMPAEAVIVTERREGRLVAVTTAGSPDATVQGSIPLEATILGSVLEAGEPHRVDDWADVRGTVEPEATPPEERLAAAYRSMLCAPIGTRGIIVALARDPGVFDTEDTAMLDAIGSMLAHAVDRFSRPPGEVPGISEETLDEIARLVTHDLTNKLGVAKGRLELVRQSGELDHLDDCERALDGIESIGRIVATLARTGVPVDRIVPVSLAEAAEDAFAGLGPGTATLSTPPDVDVHADASCLGQLLENLIRNAIEHGDPPVAIAVGLHQDGFYVADDGPGIPPEIREEVAAPGFSTRADHDGKGLSIVDRLARAHGWSMTISESETGGARIEFHGVRIDRPDD